MIVDGILRNGHGKRTSASQRFTTDCDLNLSCVCFIEKTSPALGRERERERGRERGRGRGVI